MQMYLDALLTFIVRSQREKLRLDEVAELASHGLSLDKYKSHEEMEEGKYMAERPIFQTANGEALYPYVFNPDKAFGSEK